MPHVPDFRGVRLIDRIDWAHANLGRVPPQYRIAWEDPAELEAPLKITIPGDRWLAAALAGGILPPIEAYLEMPMLLRIELEADVPGEGRIKATKVIRTTYARSWEVHRRAKAKGAKVHETVLPTHKLHSAPPIGPMTEQQATEYIMQRSIPPRVWDGSTKTNRELFRFVHASQIPTDRRHRNYWTFTDLERTL